MQEKGNLSKLESAQNRACTYISAMEDWAKYEPANRVRGVGQLQQVDLRSADSQASSTKENKQLSCLFYLKFYISFIQLNYIKSALLS